MMEDDDNVPNDDNPTQRRLQIARALAAKTFKFDQKVKPQENILEKHVKGVGTHEIIRNSKYHHLYTMEIERLYTTTFHLKNVLIEMKKMTQYPTVSTKSLVRTLREGLKVLHIT